MKRATVRQLRHQFGTVMATVEQGEAVEISKRGKVVALVCPPPSKASRKRKRPDFAARLRRIFGDKPLAGNGVLIDRRSRDY